MSSDMCDGFLKALCNSIWALLSWASPRETGCAVYCRRTVAIVNVEDLKRHLKNEGIIGKDPKSWLKDTTPSGLAAPNLQLAS
jgi:hypothetical protein